MRTVRIEAVATLLGIHAGRWSAQDRAALKVATAEYLEARAFNSDRGEGLVDLAHVALLAGDVQHAEDNLREALDIDRTFTAAYVNLADLYRSQQRDEEAEAALREGLKAAADRAAVEFALGLTLIRLGRHPARATFRGHGAPSPRTRDAPRGHSVWVRLCGGPVRPGTESRIAKNPRWHAAALPRQPRDSAAARRLQSADGAHQSRGAIHGAAKEARGKSMIARTVALFADPLGKHHARRVRRRLRKSNVDQGLLTDLGAHWRSQGSTLIDRLCGN
ncbi:MAG: hypothetical protein JRD94_04965 [Deltaproteobacteria bacterium]|nr:hypothetical protein [Deltaproteobacteria bacterium]